VANPGHHPPAGLHATLTTPPHAAPVLGCRTRLQNAFINLFLNARDAMPAGGCFTVGLHRLEGRPEREGAEAPAWRITVRDTGLGMDGRTLARLFERRFTTKGSRGNGHGLANVLATVRMHGRSIEVDSEPGRGTEFRILLPEAPDEDVVV
jgi:signal transduction histidine kinase